MVMHKIDRDEETADRKIYKSHRGAREASIYDFWFEKDRLSNPNAQK